MRSRGSAPQAIRSAQAGFRSGPKIAGRSVAIHDAAKGEHIATAPDNPL